MNKPKRCCAYQVHPNHLSEYHSRTSLEAPTISRPICTALFSNTPNKKLILLIKLTKCTNTSHNHAIIIRYINSYMHIFKMLPSLIPFLRIVPSLVKQHICVLVHHSPLIDVSVHHRVVKITPSQLTSLTERSVMATSKSTIMVCHSKQRVSERSSLASS